MHAVQVVERVYANRRLLFGSLDVTNAQLAPEVEKRLGKCKLFRAMLTVRTCDIVSRLRCCAGAQGKIWCEVLVGLVKRLSGFSLLDTLYQYNTAISQHTHVDWINHGYLQSVRLQLTCAPNNCCRVCSLADDRSEQG